MSRDDIGVFDKGKGRAQREEDNVEEDAMEVDGAETDKGGTSHRQNGTENGASGSGANGTSSRNNGAGAAESEGVYDPDQPREEKRKLRQNYRNLLNDLVSDRARDPDSIGAKELRMRLESANELYRHVKGPAEAVLDSSLLNTIGDIALQEARKLKVGGDYFDTEDFVAKLKLVVSGGPADGGGSRNRPPASQNGSPGRRRGPVPDMDDAYDDDEEVGGQGSVKGWDTIGALATKFTLRVPPVDFMLGPLAIPEKKRAQHKQRAREGRANNAEKVQATQIGKDDIQDEAGTPLLVMHVADVLENVGGTRGINLFRFLINPESFTQTVENIFYTSFLIKDRKAAIEIIDEDGHPQGEKGDVIIFASEPPSDEERAEGDLEPRQIVLEMDQKMWKDAIKAYGITQSTIPTRKYAERAKGKWYGGS